MDRHLKERLVGALVLVAVAIIFVPMVLDGPRDDAATEQALNLPPMSESGSGNIRRAVIDLVPSTAGTATDSEPEGIVEVPAAAKPETSPPVDNSDVGNAAQAVKNAPESAEPVSTPAALSTVPSNATSTPTTSGQAPSSPTSSDTPSSSTAAVESALAISESALTDPMSGWVVQVGSFQSRDNAMRLSTELNTKDYPAFVSRHVSNAGSVLYRVRVGPEKERTRVENLATRLKNDGQNTTIVAYP